MDDQKQSQPQQVNRPTPMQSLQLTSIDAVEMLQKNMLTPQMLVSYLQISFTYGTQDAIARLAPKPPARDLHPEGGTPN